MQIAVIGKGKLGKEIVNLILSSKRFILEDLALVWICRNPADIDALQQMVEKKLRKNALNFPQACSARSLDRVRIQANLEGLWAIDLAIETITEDLHQKRTLLANLCNQCAPSTIIATNTSSIPLERIFTDLPNPERFAGMHFFYPAKLTPIVEINTTQQTSPNTIQLIEQVVEALALKSVVFSGANNMFFSKLLLDLMNEAFLVLGEGNLTHLEIDEVVKDHIMLLGTFEILNQTGSEIVIQGFDNFDSPERTAYYAPFKTFLRVPLRVPGTQRESVWVPGTLIKEEAKADAALRLKAVLANTTAVLIQQGAIDKETLDYATTTVLGMNNTISSLVRAEEEQLAQALAARFEKTQLAFYKENRISAWL